MMNRWGDTPRGMVESCLELLAVCNSENFTDVVISMKASNTLSMVHAVRLLVHEMEQRNMSYPLHLGVTEAGDGEDGRIKSAVGIGALLHDGIGDTIRVSLSEEPEAEIPVARQLVDHIAQKNGHEMIVASEHQQFSRFEYTRRITRAVENIGGENVPVVLMNRDGGFTTIPDFLFKGDKMYSQTGGVYAVYTSEQTDAMVKDKSMMKFLRLSYPELTEKTISLLKKEENVIILLSSTHQNSVGEMRAFFHKLLENQILTPVILSKKYNVQHLQELQIMAAADTGVLFLDGFGDGLHLELEDNATVGAAISIEAINGVAFGILQASRVRVTKTEYISCPGCGRTLFNLQTVIARVKASTSHLKGLKVAIMGCIVNGPGEMADADYGYVGAGRGKVSLYKKKECLQRNINEEEAVDRLVELIKENGDWHD
jgi:(E)-4-hydroxy-3-methylbut-2-enyl-diphosphate synthase